ncbi:MAG: aminotransferase class V-fold PLP-dependent enzyme [Methanomicrobiaceae archaeon]|nr:aminotransferase class V-fold PLP-dependent enzyme [Methanomicrobiaceae archaeon]
MRDPPIKKILYWCEGCNLPLMGRTCNCGKETKSIPLLQPYDVRPALKADRALIADLVGERFGPLPLPQILLLNKTGGTDRNDLVIAHGERFGWLSFDPVERVFRFDIAPGALPFVVGHASRGVVDLEAALTGTGGQKLRRIGGKRLPVATDEPEGTVIVAYKGRYGTGVLKDGHIRVKEVVPVEPKHRPDPSWGDAVDANRFHLKNLERNAVRAIRQHISDRPCANVSFSGGKDSTAVLILARKAGVREAFFLDTGIEFPETVEFVREQGIEVVPPTGDFWSAVARAGPPGKDHRWCCKLLKLNPLKRYLARTGPCVTVQGNRWYESWNRADLDITSQNPHNPLQLNISPIRHWRALEVYLYLWWQGAAINPLYERGLERIGCYLCPAMLECEHEKLREMHPDLAERWDGFLARYARERGLPEAYHRWGLWRWKELPRKMQELCRVHGVSLEEDPGRYAAAPAPVLPQEEREERTGMNVEDIRKDFPILGDVIYFDNAATSFSPEPVVAAMVEFERNYRANVGRGVHRLTQIASHRYWHAHQKVARFIGGEEGVLAFTRNSTEAINMISHGLAWKPGDRVVTTVLEHHSNLVPWQALARYGVAVDIVDIEDDYTFDLSRFEEAITDETRLVAVSHASNVLGTIAPVGEIARICRDHGALLAVDAAQTAPQMPIDVKDLGCDFFCISGHKMLGPTGTGALWMKEAILEPMITGGGMIETVTRSGYTLAEGYQRYEAGTPNIGGGIGLGAAVDYLERIGMDAVRQHEQALASRMIEGLSAMEGVRVYAQENPAARIGVVSFTVEGVVPHEVAQYLDESADIMVRSGHHCAMPLMEHLGLENGTVRASLAVYNTEAEVDTLLASVLEMIRGL